MMKDLWINLPVKDVEKSKEFFAGLGFSFNEQYGNRADSACLLVGAKNVVVMLFSEPAFKGFSKNEISDAGRGTEILLSIGAESKEEVDEMARKAAAAGGTVFGEPGGQDWMYGCGFADLDGHRWNVLYMDMSKMPRQ